MPNKEIEIIIPADGSPPSLEALGYSGKECTTEIEKFIKTLGAQKISKKQTADYYRKEKVKVNQHIV